MSNYGQEAPGEGQALSSFHSRPGPSRPVSLAPSHSHPSLRQAPSLASSGSQLSLSFPGAQPSDVVSHAPLQLNQSGALVGSYIEGLDQLAALAPVMGCVVRLASALAITISLEGASEALQLDHGWLGLRDQATVDLAREAFRQVYTLHSQRQEDLSNPLISPGLSPRTAFDRDVENCKSFLGAASTLC